MPESEMPIEQRLRQRRARYQPQNDHVITVKLTGEVIRGKIVNVIDDMNVIVEMLGYNLSRDHGYKKGDLIPCRYGRDEIGIIGWSAVPERELKEAERANRERDMREAIRQELAAEMNPVAAAPAAVVEAPAAPAKKTGWWQRRPNAA
jgi:hypothetical protein